jgi:hypothetical protein
MTSVRLTPTFSLSTIALPDLGKASMAPSPALVAAQPATPTLRTPGKVAGSTRASAANLLRFVSVTPDATAAVGRLKLLNKQQLKSAVFTGETARGRFDLPLLQEVTLKKGKLLSRGEAAGTPGAEGKRRTGHGAHHHSPSAAKPVRSALKWESDPDRPGADSSQLDPRTFTSEERQATADQVLQGARILMDRATAGYRPGREELQEKILDVQRQFDDNSAATAEQLQALGKMQGELQDFYNL